MSLALFFGLPQRSFAFLWLLISGLVKGGDAMKMKRANPKVDRQIFRRTAGHTKAVNLGKIRFRGGIRF